jgi:hypothetical protein
LSKFKYPNYLPLSKKKEGKKFYFLLKSAFSLLKGKAPKIIFAFGARFFRGLSLVAGTEKENVCLNNGAGDYFCANF